MKKPVLLFSIIFSLTFYVLGFSSVFADQNRNQQPANNYKNTINILVPANTKVFVRTLSLIKTVNIQEDDLIDLQVSRDVMINHQIVIKAGAKANGKIATFLNGKYKESHFVMEVTSVTAVDQQLVSTVSMFTLDSLDKGHHTHLAIGSPENGYTKVITIPENTEFTVTTLSDVMIKVLKP